MENNTFTTITEVHNYIATAIEASGAASRDEYDLDIIATAVATWDDARQRYIISEDPDDTEAFWAAVAAAAL